MDKVTPLPAFTFFLFAAIAVYGLLGSPTPDNPGMVEAATGILLAALLVSAGLGKALRLTLGRTLFLKSLQILFLCGLILPTLSGVYFGNDPALIVRDLAAFFFLALPLFLSERFDGQERAQKLLCGFLIFAGFAFAARTLAPVFKIWRAPEELLYLSNSPLTLFAAVWLAGALWANLMALTRPSLVRAAGAAFALAVILAAMLLDVQRATIGAVFVTLFGLAVIDFALRPKRAALPLLLLALGMALIFPLVWDTLQAMAAKTAEVGMNARMAEARAVVDALSADPVTFFTGYGWGAVYASPAVAGLEVNYTHSFLTTLLLKGGMILFIAGFGMTLAALREIFFIFQRDRARAVALFWPVVIPVFLYASHKSLDFGLTLLMLGVWSSASRAWTSEESSDKTEASTVNPK